MSTIPTNNKPFVIPQSASRLIVLLIILLSFAVRLHQLDAVALRGDEAFSAQYWAGLPWQDALQQIATIEPHPPLTYILFNAWGTVFTIDNPWLLRLLPVLASLLGIAGIYQLTHLLTHDHYTALIATFIASLHPFLIWHAQDFRNYALWQALTPLVIASALRYLHHARIIHAIGFIILAIFTTLVFYFEVITLAIIGLYGVIRHRNQPRWLLSWGAMIAFIATFPIISFVSLQSDLIGQGAYGGNTGAFSLNALWRHFIPTLLWGDTYEPDMMNILAGFTITFIITVTGVAIQQRKQSWLLPLMFVYLPITAISLIALRVNIFHPRYVIMVTPALIILLATFIMHLWRRQQRPFATLLTLLWLTVAGWGILNYFNNANFRKAPDWHHLINYVAQNANPDDLIIQVSVDASFGYYYDIIAPHTPQIALPIDPHQTQQIIENALQTYQSRYHRLWIVGNTLSDWPNAGMVEAWANANMQPIRHLTIDQLPATEYAPYHVPYTQHTQPLAIFPDAASLLHYTVHEPIAPSQTLTIEVYWRTILPTSTPLTSFVHLVGAINPATNTPLWAQDDHPPQNGRLMTHTWAPDTIYRDVYYLDIEKVPQGDYEILIGFYDSNGVRLSTSIGDNVASLTTIKRP